MYQFFTLNGWEGDTIIANIIGIFAILDKNFHFFKHGNTIYRINTHTCQYCLFFYVKIPSHVSRCQVRRQSQAGSGPLRYTPNAPLLPHNLDTGKFSLSLAASFGTVATFSYKFTGLVESFEDAINLCYPDIRNIVTQLINHWRGLRMSVDVHSVVGKIRLRDHQAKNIVHYRLACK